MLSEWCVFLLLLVLSKRLVVMSIRVCCFVFVLGRGICLVSSGKVVGEGNIWDNW